MHHEIVGMLFLVEVLQQKARVTVMEVGKIRIRPSQHEAEVLVELLRQTEIARGHEGLRFDGRKIIHARLLLRPAGRRPANRLIECNPCHVANERAVEWHQPQLGEWDAGVAGALFGCE
jgi:hypothetical protein